MRNLFEIEKEIDECVMIDPETGEDLGTDWARLDRLMMERDTKLENVAVWYKNIAAERDAVQAEKMRLQKRQKALETRMEGIKVYLAEHLNGEIIATGRVKTGYHTTKDVVNILDREALPEEFRRVPEWEPDKTAIKNAIKTGTSVAGAELVNKISLTIK